jgi:DNA-binding winged helix-turn-helix (wHTH) protein
MRLRFDEFILDVARRELWRGSEPVVVEPQVFDLLVYLVQNPERVVTKDELLQAVWDGRIVSESAITNRVNAARRAIGDSGKAQRLIRTVPRKGLRFIGAIEKEAVESIKETVPRGSRRRQGIALAVTAAVSVWWAPQSPRLCCGRERAIRGYWRSECTPRRNRQRCRQTICARL